MKKLALTLFISGLFALPAKANNLMELSLKANVYERFVEIFSTTDNLTLKKVIVNRGNNCGGWDSLQNKKKLEEDLQFEKDILLTFRFPLETSLYVTDKMNQFKEAIKELNKINKSEAVIYKTLKFGDSFNVKVCSNAKEVTVVLKDNSEHTFRF